MAWIASYVNESSDQKVTPTMNGPGLFNSGAFSISYGSMSTTSTSEWSIVSNQLAATALTNPLSGASAPAAVKLSGDPTGKYPGSTLYLPGFNSKAVQGGMGAFTLGTVIKATFVSTFTAGGTFVPKLVLRNPVTGAVAYTLTNTSTYSPTASAVGSILTFTLAIVSSTQVYATYRHDYSTASAVGVPATTTVDFSQDYVLDATITMGTSGTWAQNLAIFELVG